MGKGKGMGKYYERKDGTNIGMDHTDRRRKSLVTQAAEPKKDVGDSRHKQDSTLRQYMITFNDGTTNTVAGRSEKAVRAQYGRLGIKDIELVNKRKK